MISLRICFSDPSVDILEDIILIKFHLAVQDEVIHNLFDGGPVDGAVQSQSNLVMADKREKTCNIGMVCAVHPKKNIPLALQILNTLPQKYTLHLAGPQQDNCLMEYLSDIARKMQRHLFYYGKLTREKLDSWWDMMDCCLSTSICEGNPNNVIEAMAKGIKPVVHNWPGAKDQFHEHYIFDTIDDAVMIINSDFNKPEQHRDWVKERYSLDNLDKIYEVIEGVCG